MNKEKLQNLRKIAYRTIRILREIEVGHRSPTIIALKTKSTPALVNYYLRAVGIKGRK